MNYEQIAFVLEALRQHLMQTLPSQEFEAENAVITHIEQLFMRMELDKLPPFSEEKPDSGFMGSLDSILSNIPGIRVIRLSSISRSGMFGDQFGGPFDPTNPDRRPFAMNFLRFSSVDDPELNAIMDEILGGGQSIGTFQQELLESVPNMDEKPLTRIARDLVRARAGQMPFFNGNAYLEMFGLDGNEPDGKTLIERIGHDSIEGDLITLRSALYSVDGFLRAIESGRDLKSTEKLIIATLISCLESQLVREGAICDIAVRYGKRLIAANPSALNEAAKAVLAQS